MKKFTDILIFCVVSVEMLVALSLLLIYIRWPNILGGIGGKLMENNEPIKYLALIPPGVIALIVKDRKDLLFPDDPALKVLQEWPNYYMIKNRYFSSLIIASICSLATIGIWSLGLDLGLSSCFALFAGSIIISAVTYFNFIHATIEIKRILSKYKK